MGQRADALDQERARAEHAEEETDPTEIREEIEQTRDEMSVTIDAIQEKLDPHRLVAEAKETVREEADQRVQQAKATVQWEASHRLQQLRGKLMEYVALGRHLLFEAQQQVFRMRDQAPAQLQQLREQAPGQAQSQVQRAQAWYQRTSREEPETIRNLAIGLGSGVVALTAIVLRARDVQHRRTLAGKTQNTVDAAQDAIEDVIDAVGDTVEDAARNVRRALW